jgi:hypothetical protein
MRWCASIMNAAARVRRLEPRHGDARKRRLVLLAGRRRPFARPPLPRHAAVRATRRGQYSERVCAPPRLARRARYRPTPSSSCPRSSRSIPSTSRVDREIAAGRRPSTACAPRWSGPVASRSSIRVRRCLRPRRGSACISRPIRTGTTTEPSSDMVS